MQLIVDLFQPEAYSFDTPEVLGINVKTALSERYGLSVDMIVLFVDGCALSDFNIVPNDELVLIKGTLKVRGGKGGYGAMLRHLAKQSGKKKTTDFGACRDLSGRRLRHVNDEIILQKWKDAREKGAELDVEEITQTGIDMWFLPAPGWVDGFKKPDPRKKFMKGRKKTRICLDWEKARKDGRVPKNAPVWWGCPRGPRCEYAHGESELPPEMIKQLKEARKSEKAAAALEKRLNYTSVLETDNSEEISALVMAGLNAAKRLKVEADKKSTDSVEEEVLPLFDTDEIAGVSIGKSIASRYLNPVKDTAAIEVSEAGDLLEEMAPETALSCSWLNILTGAAEESGRQLSASSYSPPAVNMNGLIVANGEEGLGSVAVTGCFLSSGKWYFEVELFTDGLVQIGMADESFSVSPAAGDGVGDDAHSWSFDGARSCIWHNGEQKSFGQNKPWSAGDVVGVYVSVANRAADADLQTEKKKRGRGEVAEAIPSNQRQISLAFSMNGVLLGDAFTNVGSSSYYFPVVSIEAGESAQINIGQKPFQQYRPADGDAYSPILSSLDADIADALKEYMSFYASTVLSPDVPLTSETGADDATQGDAKHTLSSSPADAVSHGTEVANQPSAPMSFEPIDIDSVEFSTSAESFHRYGLAHLKSELERRGLKSGGTLIERADRLFAVRGLTPDKIDKKYKVKSSAT